VLVSLIIISAIMMMFLASMGNTAYAQGPIRVACVGDSITQGSGYPADLQKILGKDYTVANFGVSGSAVSTKATKPYMNQYEFWRAVNFQPDIVVIMLGTNDANVNTYQDIDNFQNNYKDIINKFQELPGNQQIILVDPPPILNNTLSLSNDNLVQGVIPKIDQVANDLNLTTVNVYQALVNHTEVLGDGVHPSTSGGQLIAEQVNQSINSYDPNYYAPGFPYP
jgi:acyl-CoA thioesterase I